MTSGRPCAAQRGGAGTPGLLVWAYRLGACLFAQPRMRSIVWRPGFTLQRALPRHLAFLIPMLLLGVPSAGLAQLPPGGINLKALFAAVGRMHNIDADLLEAMAEV